MSVHNERIILSGIEGRRYFIYTGNNFSVYRGDCTVGKFFTIAACFACPRVKSFIETGKREHFEETGSSCLEQTWLRDTNVFCSKLFSPILA